MCPTLCNLMDCNMPGFPVHHQLPELAQPHGHHSDAFCFQFPIHGAAVAENEGLGCAVGRDVGNRLEGGKAVQLQNI